MLGSGTVNSKKYGTLWLPTRLANFCTFYSHTQIAINHADLNTVLNFLWAHTRNQNNRSSICIIWRDRSK